VKDRPTDGTNLSQGDRGRSGSLGVAIVIFLAAAVAATCSSSSSSPGGAVSSAGSTLEQAKTTVCEKLADASSAVASAQAGQNGEYASKASTLATDLQAAASLLRTVGASSTADDVSNLATDLQSLASAAPGDVDQLALGIQSEITSIEGGLACPGASPGASVTASSSPSM
jgi:hypothetical protein